MKTSARTLFVGAIVFGLSFTPSLADSPTSDGPTITDGTGPADTSTGDAGYDGHAGHDGGNGGNGGNVTSVVEQSGSNGVGAGSLGGNGGKGGAGDPGDPEQGRDPIPGGGGGNGGNAGDVNLTVTGNASGYVGASSIGGDAGEAAQGVISEAVGGSGGDVALTIAATAVVDGQVMAGSKGGESNGEKPDGQSGDVTVTISGAVLGGVTAQSSGDEQTAGKIKVVIDGGVVTGTIAAISANSSRELAFKFDVADRAEFKAASAALTGNGAEGQVRINGHTYSWEGFSALVDLLRYVGPEDKVVVSVTESSGETTTVGEAMQHPAADRPKVETSREQPKLVGDIPLIVGKPEMARCSGGNEIRTVRQDDGSLVVIHRTNGADTLVGQLKDGEFRRNSDAPDWDIRVGDEGRTVQVTDATGNALSNCSFN